MEKRLSSCTLRRIALESVASGNDGNDVSGNDVNDVLCLHGAEDNAGHQLCIDFSKCRHAASGTTCTLEEVAWHCFGWYLCKGRFYCSHCIIESPQWATKARKRGSEFRACCKECKQHSHTRGTHQPNLAVFNSLPNGAEDNAGHVLRLHGAEDAGHVLCLHGAEDNAGHVLRWHGAEDA